MNNEKIIKNLIINYCDEDKYKLKKYDKKNIRNELRIYYASYSKLINRYIREKEFRISNRKKGVNVKSLLKLGLELNPKEFFNDIFNFYNKYKPNTDHLTILGILVKNYVLFDDKESILTLKKLLKIKEIDFNNLIRNTIKLFKSKIKEGCINWQKSIVLENKLFNEFQNNKTCQTLNDKSKELKTTYENEMNKEQLPLVNSIYTSEKDRIEISDTLYNLISIQEAIINIFKDKNDYKTIKEKIDLYLNKITIPEDKRQLLMTSIACIEQKLNTKDVNSIQWQKYLNLGLYIEPKLFFSEIIMDYYRKNDDEILSYRLNHIDWNNENLDYLIKLIKKSTRLPIQILNILKISSKSTLAKYELKQRYGKGYLKEEYEYFIKDEKANLTKQIEIPTTANVIKECIIPSENKDDNIDFEGHTVNENIEGVENNNTELKESNTDKETLEVENKKIELSTPLVTYGCQLSQTTLIDNSTNNESELSNYCQEDNLLTSLHPSVRHSSDTSPQVEALENNLYKSGVSESECKSFASYLLSAYMHRIPVLLAGSCGEQIANAFSASICGAMPYVFDCKKEYNTNFIEDILKSKNEIVVIKHPFATEWRETLLEILAEGEKFYILINPFYEDLQIEPMSLYNSVMPFITELIIDKPPIFETLKPTKIELPEPTNKFISMHNELLKDMKLSSYCINQIQTLLSEMHHILYLQSKEDENGLPRHQKMARNDDSKNKFLSNLDVKTNYNEFMNTDYKYVLFPYAYVTNQGDSISEKWLKIDKDAERYISKYFNIIKTAIEY